MKLEQPTVYYRQTRIIKHTYSVAFNIFIESLYMQMGVLYNLSENQSDRRSPDKQPDPLGLAMAPVEILRRLRLRCETSERASERRVRVQVF
jgi:hypothetical protein